jgi:hypothetical protein
MRSARWGQWYPLWIVWALTLGLVVLVFIPQHRRADRTSAEALTAAGELRAKVATLAQVPVRKHRLDSLVHELQAFQAGLAHTDQVDHAMRTFAERARAAAVRCWILNPSVPTLVALDQATDSIAALNLALLPVEFECQGPYVAVGRFLESEEQRPQFCRWRRLTLSPGPGRDEVRASGEVQLFLLPAEQAKGGAT